MSAPNVVPIGPAACEHATVDLAQLPHAVADVLEHALNIESDSSGEVFIENLVHIIRVCLELGLTRSHSCALVHSWRPAQEWVMGQTPGQTICLAAQLGWSKAQKPLPRTDMGTASRLAIQHSGDFAWTPELGGWLHFDGRRWTPDDGTAIFTRAKRVARRLAAEADALASDADEVGEEQVKAARRWAASSQSVARVKAAVELVRSEPGVAVPGSLWDADPELLATRNGKLILTPDGVQPGKSRRSDHITRLVPTVYQPLIKSQEWLAFVEQCLPDAEVRRFFQKIAGYSLFGGNPERIMVILKGKTSTGKTTILESMAGVLGDYASDFSLAMFRSKETEGPRPDLVDALPARMIFTSEASDRWKLHADEVKRLTGGDTVRARTLHSKTFIVRRPAFVPLVATNEAPTILGGDEALWRRLVVIPFDNQVSRVDEDRGLARRLVAEESTGILTWFCEGWDLYTAEGLRNVPAACEAAALELRSDLSLLDRWLAEETEQGPEFVESLAELWGAWSAWCAESGVLPIERLNRVSFGRSLTAKGFGESFVGGRSARKRARTGLRVTAEAKEARALLDLE